MSLAFAGAAARLTSADIDAEAQDLGVHPAVIRAVCDVEAAGSGFLPDGRPKILFEAHLFGRLTGHIWDQALPNVSARRWDRSLYGPGGAHQYTRLAKAIAVDRNAALKSASWGMFQVLGLNHAACGYPDVESFVAAMIESERAHLDAFTKFCIANRLDDELRANPPRFADFARGYNGPGYAANAYDVKLAGAYRKWLATVAASDNPAPRTLPEQHYRTLHPGASGEAVRRLQLRLRELGYDVPSGGRFDEETRAAVEDFQASVGLNDDGVVGPLTRAALSRPR